MNKKESKSEVEKEKVVAFVAQKNATQQMSKKVGYRLRTYNEVKSDAAKLPPAIRLFGDFIYKNELTIICGDTNVGKSILANQIVVAISEGKDAMSGFKNECKPIVSVLVDLELSDRQFSKRLGKEDYNGNLKRMDVDPDCQGCEIDIKDIVEVSKDENNEAITIDNVTALLKNPAKEGEIAIKFMSDLNQIKRENKKTLLAITHIPKRYETTPLTNNDIGGSKAIASFADSILFIARSVKGPQFRYLKHTKGRNSVIDMDKVYVIELKENEKGLYFEFLYEDVEINHLFKQSFNKSERDQEMLDLRSQGHSMEKIGEMVGVHKGTVSKRLAKIDKE